MFGDALEYVRRNAGDLNVRDADNFHRVIIDVLEGMGGGLGGGIEQGLRDIKADPAMVGRVASRADYIRDSAINTRRIFNELTAIHTAQGDLWGGFQNVLGDLDILKTLGIVNARGLAGAGFGQEPQDEVKYEGYRPGEQPADLFNGLLGQLGIGDEAKAQIRGLIDADGNGNIDANELKSAFNDNSIINKLGEVNPALARMFKDPSFRSRTIQRLPTQSIYGEDTRAGTNQVTEVLQGIALNEQDQNYFNVNF